MVCQTRKSRRRQARFASRLSHIQFISDPTGDGLIHAEAAEVGPDGGGRLEHVLFHGGDDVKPTFSGQVGYRSQQLLRVSFQRVHVVKLVDDVTRPGTMLEMGSGDHNDTAAQLLVGTHQLKAFVVAG